MDIYDFKVAVAVALMAGCFYYLGTQTPRNQYEGIIFSHFADNSFRYNETKKCLAYTRELVNDLRDKGYEAYISTNIHHAWTTLCLQVESETGEILQPNKYEEHFRSDTAKNYEIGEWLFKYSEAKLRCNKQD